MSESLFYLCVMWGGVIGILATVAPYPRFLSRRYFLMLAFIAIALAGAQGGHP